MSIEIKAPSSKSYAQRAVACALLANGESVLGGVDMSDDTRAALDTAYRLGADIFTVGDTIHIKGGLSPRASEIDIGESGLSTRLFTPIASLLSTCLTINGHGSIVKRPMGLMLSSLEQLGVKISSSDGFLPLAVCGPIRAGRTVEVDGSLSSQFLTGLLTALPLVDGDTELSVRDLQSRPYIDITLDVLRSFGVEVHNQQYEHFSVKGSQIYRPTHYTIEGDWSGASCLLVLKAITRGEFHITNLRHDSVQADRAIVDAIERAGSELNAFEFDATHCPDLFPALVALAAHCKGVSKFVGTSRLTHKESNRAEALRSEFAKIGIEVDVDSTENVMYVHGGEVRRSGVIDPHGDHRIAMAVAVAAWDCDIEIADQHVVNKSYPQFWTDLNTIVDYLKTR